MSTAWVDRQLKRYKMEDIKDSHLLNILRYMCKGGGYVDYMSFEIIENLFAEADKRGLKHSNSIHMAIDAYKTKSLAEAFREMEMEWDGE